MAPLKPGWYCFTAPNATDDVANDRQGPFETFDDLRNWLVENKVEFRYGARYFIHGPLYFSEMTGDESEGMWATYPHMVWK